jgi:hypothetical protein
MKPETLHEHIHAVPFKPIITTAAGQRIEVMHPDFIAHPPSGRVGVVFDRQERSYYVDVMLITSIEPGSVARAAAERGNSPGALTTFAKPST